LLITVSPHSDIMGVDNDFSDRDHDAPEKM
jgi:hypothetical protein